MTTPPRKTRARPVRYAASERKRFMTWLPAEVADALPALAERLGAGSPSDAIRRAIMAATPGPKDPGPKADQGAGTRDSRRVFYRLDPTEAATLQALGEAAGVSDSAAARLAIEQALAGTPPPSPERKALGRLVGASRAFLDHPGGEGARKALERAVTAAEGLARDKPAPTRPPTPPGTAWHDIQDDPPPYRIAKILEQLHLRTFTDILRCHPLTLQRVRGFGPTLFRDLEDWLSRHGHPFNDPPPTPETP